MNTHHLFAWCNFTSEGESLIYNANICHVRNMTVHCCCVIHEDMRDVIQPDLKQSGHNTFYPFIDASNSVERLWNKSLLFIPVSNSLNRETVFFSTAFFFFMTKSVSEKPGSVRTFKLKASPLTVTKCRRWRLLNVTCVYLESLLL